MDVYTMIHVRRTPVRRTCTAYMYHSVNTLLMVFQSGLQRPAEGNTDRYASSVTRNWGTWIHLVWGFPSLSFPSSPFRWERCSNLMPRRPAPTLHTTAINGGPIRSSGFTGVGEAIFSLQRRLWPTNKVKIDFCVN